jgi:hypothetical protein
LASSDRVQPIHRTARETANGSKRLLVTVPCVSALAVQRSRFGHEACRGPPQFEVRWRSVELASVTPR